MRAAAEMTDHNTSMEDIQANLRGLRIAFVIDACDSSIGRHLTDAADELKISYVTSDVRTARAGRLLNSLSHRFLNRRPPRMRSFERRLLTLLRNTPGINALLVTGLAPISRDTLIKVGQLGIARANYLTDDPWNKSHRAKWLLDGLNQYDLILSPRLSNIPQLLASGVQHVAYLPFAFNPLCHHPVLEPGESDTDIVFVGGADADRAPILSKLAQEGFKLELFGGYWQRYPATASFSRGIASFETINRASSRAKMTLILTRRANRDGHVMRSFEAAACGECLLVEKTPEHLELFGQDGDCVRFFSTVEDLVATAHELKNDVAQRTRLKEAVYKRIALDARNTYKDRLINIANRITDL